MLRVTLEITLNLENFLAVTNQQLTSGQHRENSGFYLFIYLFNLFFIFYLILAALGLRCCVQAFSSCGELGLFFVVVCELLIAVASVVAEHGL